MVKDKTAALECAKKATGAAKGKKQNRGSSSRAGLPPGWIQGDWIRSSIRQEDLDELAESELIAKGAARCRRGRWSLSLDRVSVYCSLPMSTGASRFHRTPSFGAS